MRVATRGSSIRVNDGRPSVPHHRLEASGHRFRFPDIEGALRHLLGRAA